MVALLDRGAAGAVFASGTGEVGADAFVAQVLALAARLPPGRHLVNLCRDRLGFAVAFAAGLVAGRTSLLNVEPASLRTVAARYGGCVVLAEEPVPGCALPFVPVRPQGTAPVPQPMPLIAADHLAAIVFTSGSTGEPVAHEKSWGSLVARAKAGAAQFALSGGTVIGMVPPQHMYGFETTIMLPLQSGIASWCGPAFFPGDVAAALPHCPAPRILVTTPLQLRTLRQAGIGLPGLSACISATAPLDRDLAADCEAAWGAAVLEIFGATECGSIASRRTTATETWTPYPGITLDLEEAGDAGAVVHAPFEPPVPLADVLQPDGDGFRLLGRRADVVKLAGRRASLPGLNHVLTGLEGVSDGAFVVPEAPDGGAAARLVAVVVAPGRSGADILAELRQVLDPVFVPRRVVHVDRLPRNAMGKLPRHALLQLVAQP